MFNMQPIASTRNYSTLYIGDLEEQITEEMLYSVFIKFGPIFSLRVMKDFHTKKSRGFGFVSYYNVVDGNYIFIFQQSAKNARQQTNHSVILSRPIRITWKKHIKEMAVENNIFVKNIPKNTTEKEFEEIFLQFGSVFSSKISYDENGVSRCYGYVQFEDKEGTDKCLSSTVSLVLHGQKIEALPFAQKSSRPELNSNNLYIKNLPKIELNEASKQLTEICQKFGEVTSVLTKIDNSTGQPFAFVCFKNHNEANNAFNALQTSDPFNQGSNLYVNWAQKKVDRLRQLKQLHQNQKNETNIFSRNIKLNVTKQEIEEAYSVFGEIQSCLVKDPQNIKYQTLMAFINFKSKESALACLMGATTSEKIKNLYGNEKVYVNLHVPKSQQNSFDRAKQRMQPQIDPMQMIKQMQMFMSGQMMPQQNMMQFMQPQMGMINPQMMGTLRGGRNPPPRGFGGFPPKPFGNQQPNKSQKPQEPKKEFSNVSDIKNNLQAFTTLDQEKQRSYLGEILFPMVQEIIKVKDDVPRVTGMLVDFEVFELTDILEILESRSLLAERVEEAESLIEEERAQA